MEEALRKQGIPYRIYGGLSFYQRKEIKDVIAYLRLVINPNDEEALKRIINVPARGIGDTTVNKLMETAQTHQVSAWTVLSDILKYNLPVNAGTATKLANFRDLIQNFSNQITTLNAYELANNVVKATGIIGDQYDKSVENLSRIDNIQELLKAIHEYVEAKAEEGMEFVNLTDFLSEVSLLTDQDTDKNDKEKRVTLMTVHAAKGLEYNTVFIVGMEEELFPSPFVETPRELEEERRLFYVAITRAEERCFISYAKSRFRNGKTNFSNPSRFLKDIDSRYLDFDAEQIFAPKPQRSWDDEISIERNLFRKENQPSPERFSSSQPRKLNKITSDNSTPTVNSNFPVGCFVKHQLFGIGKVIETSVVDGNERAAIDFGEKGVKSLLLKFAKLEVLK
ncbi:ATP-dependent DNA helicase PcrA (fragment) [uncultured Paludibacter sp.]|uniref:DNA 3'-5' helicase II n=1 Tax=uncultured Paludibacter sp. TaxID=497635 RepID=A0A653AD64_9BACT